MIIFYVLGLRPPGSVGVLLKVLTGGGFQWLVGVCCTSYGVEVVEVEWNGYWVGSGSHGSTVRAWSEWCFVGSWRRWL